MTECLRLVSFNILEGLRPIARSVGEQRDIDRERAEAAKAVVADLRPDILVLNEALFCRQFLGRTVDYAGLFAFPYQAAALYDDAWGNAILSRFPITRSHEMQIYNRGGLASVDRRADRGADGCLLSPASEPLPGKQGVRFRAPGLGCHRSPIVCGDLNCISPEDAIDRSAMIEAFRSYLTRCRGRGGPIHRERAACVPRLGELGLKDAIPPTGRRYSIPTDLINPDKSSAMRIDHILANDAIEVVVGEVVHSAASNRASDHHPVLVEFRLRRMEGAN